MWFWMTVAVAHRGVELVYALNEVAGELECIEDSVVVEARVDEQGRVHVHRMQSGPSTRCVRDVLQGLQLEKGQHRTVMLSLDWFEGLGGQHQVVVSLPNGPIIGPPLPKEVIARKIREQMPAIRACYGAGKPAGTSAKASAAMKMTVTEFTIRSDGSVATAHVPSTALGSGAASCVEGALEAMRFLPIPGGGVVKVRYPFLFGDWKEVPDD